MRMNNTNNLIQVEGGEKIKQADKGSWLSFALTDTKRNPIEGINGNTAKVVLYDKKTNKGWSYSTTVSDNKVRFKLPGNLEIGIYDLDITVNNMVFPSDRNTKIEIVEGATSFSGAGVSETILELAGYAKISDLDKKVDKVSGKGLSTNDYTTTDKNKVSAIPSSPKYTDTTYSAGSGLSLSGTTFSVDSTIARKSDIPNIDTALGTIDLSTYATKNDLSNKVDKVSGKGLSSNDYTSTDKSKVSAIPSSPKYTDTTYSAGSGLSLTGTTFSIDSTIARKSDIPSIDSALGTIDLSSYATKTDLSNKVDKISGKGLSANDYTSTDKNKVSAIPTSPKYTDTTYSAGSGLSLSGTTFSVDSTIARKSDIPSSVDLSGYAKTSDLNNKVDKVYGKGLSTNDYTTTDKNKVSAIPSNPKYTDTTYSAGSGLSLSGTTFSLSNSIVRDYQIYDLTKIDSDLALHRDYMQSGRVLTHMDFGMYEIYSDGKSFASFKEKYELCYYLNREGILARLKSFDDNQSLKSGESYHKISNGVEYNY